jgi:hypothetical protein
MSFSRLTVGALAAAAALAPAAPALAQGAPPKSDPLKHVQLQSPLRAKYTHFYNKVEKVTGEKPGRNIVHWGMEKPSGNLRAASAGEVADSIRTMRVLLGEPAPGTATAAPATVSTPTAGAPATAAPTAAAAGAPAAGGHLASIAQCESGGNPGAVSADGQYKGLYQFDDQTWQSVGGSGSANQASAAEQTMRAQTLMNQRGSNPWPVCGS